MREKRRYEVIVELYDKIPDALIEEAIMEFFLRATATSIVSVQRLELI